VALAPEEIREGAQHGGDSVLCLHVDLHAHPIGRVGWCVRGAGRAFDEGGGPSPETSNFRTTRRVIRVTPNRAIRPINRRTTGAAQLFSQRGEGRYRIRGLYFRMTWPHAEVCSLRPGRPGNGNGREGTKRSQLKDEAWAAASTWGYGHGA